MVLMRTFLVVVVSVGGLGSIIVSVKRQENPKLNQTKNIVCGFNDIFVLPYLRLDVLPLRLKVEKFGRGVPILQTGEKDEKIINITTKPTQ